MNSRSTLTIAFCTTFCTLLGISDALPLAAQRQETPYITVMTFQGTEKITSCRLADALRNRLTKDFSTKQLIVRTTKDVTNTLEQSGFNPCEPLPSNDEKALANLLRADMYITGTVSRTSTGYRVEPKLVLTRDVTLAQPMTPAESPRVEPMSEVISRSVRDAIKQVPGAKNCLAGVARGDIRAALLAANAAITAYPQGTLPRLCLATYYYTQVGKAKTHADSLTWTDSTLAWAGQIVQLDSNNIQALKLQADLYNVRGDSARARQALYQLVRADPANTTLLTSVIEEFGRTHHPKEAVPFVKLLLERNPGDPKSLETAFVTYLYAENWQGMTEVGPELARVDSTMADTLFYTRLAVAYGKLNQPQKSAEELAQATAKYPNVSTLWLAYSQALRKNGQIQQANEALKRAAQLDPNLGSQAALQTIDAFIKASNYDSAYVAIQRAETLPNADKRLLGQLALAPGSALYRAANASKNRADFQRAIKFLELSNQLSPSTDAQFLIGASAFSIMQTATNDANKEKSCSLAQMAREAYTTAQTNLSPGANDPKYQSFAHTMLEYLPKFKAPIDALNKKFCH